ncbi:MAG TPA: hypothetical protein DDX54_00480 [Rhodospirillaceae bacterium]|jgi:hypothetical protein|nr:hypothetical protein [Rhodospirillaceae bacterium]
MMRWVRICVVAAAFCTLFFAGTASAACGPCNAADCKKAGALVEASHASNRARLTGSLTEGMRDLRRTIVSKQFMDETFREGWKNVAREINAGKWSALKTTAEYTDADLARREHKLFTSGPAEEAVRYARPDPESDFLGKPTTAVAYLAESLPSTRELGKTITDAGLEQAWNPNTFDPWPLKQYIEKEATATGRAVLTLGPETVYGDTVPQTAIPETLTQAQALSAAVIPPRSGAEQPARGTKDWMNQAWFATILHSRAERAKENLAPTHCPKAGNILALLGDNEDLKKSYMGFGDAKCLSPGAVLDIASLSMSAKENVLPLVGASERETAEALFAAAILENIIQYKIYKSEQRQEILVAGILMYELMAHKKWRERNAPMLLALEERRRESDARVRLAAARPGPTQEKGDAP